MAEPTPFEIEELAPVEADRGMDASTSCSGTCKGMGSNCCVAFGAVEQDAVDDLEALAATEAGS